MDNVYIKGMEIGYNNPNGIKYFDLKKRIEGSSSIRFDETLESTFIKWVGECFDSTYPSNDIVNHTINMAIPYIRQEDGVRQELKDYYDDFSFRTWVIKGSTVKQYLDYLELKESRLASQQARKQSNYSIWIAIGAILISAILGWYTIKTAPQPPYDVKVIEDKTRMNDLENENRELKEELFKAEMMVRVLEDKSSNQ